LIASKKILQTMRIHRPPTIVWILLILLGQLSARALIGGGAMLMAPSGRVVGLSTTPLNGTPFRDFFVPGIVLFVVFGFAPAVTCYALYTRRRWGWLASIGVAVALVVWILVEVAIGFGRPTIYLNLGTAGAILVLASHPSVRHSRLDTKMS
jgi:hypothetical protein